MFISDHSNAVGSGMNETVDYVAVYHLTNDTKVKCDDISKEIAEALAPAMAKVMETTKGYKVLSRLSDRDKNGDGALNDNYYGVLNGARSVNTPGLIIEHGFHTNTRNVQWLLNDANLDKLAKVEANVIASYFSGQKIEVIPENPASTGVPYCIRVANVKVGDVLNIRKGPSSSTEKVGYLKYNDPNKYTIAEESNGWGKLKSGVGWINLKYTKKV